MGVCRRRDPDAGVDGDAAVREREDGVEIELRDLGQVVGEEREAQQQVDAIVESDFTRNPWSPEHAPKLSLGD